MNDRLIGISMVNKKGGGPLPGLFLRSVPLWGYVEDPLVLGDEWVEFLSEPEVLP